jgi:hypothetical protein
MTFESMAPVFGLAKTVHASDRAATVNVYRSSKYVYLSMKHALY